MNIRQRKNKNSLINISQYPVCDSVALKNALTELNSTTASYGLFLTVHLINDLCNAVQKSLIESERIEIGSGVLPLIASEFCSSVFIRQDNYANVLEDVINIFFKVKTAVCDTISDKNLIRLLKDYYENKAYGSVELMREKDIDILVKYIEMEYGQKMNASADVYESDGYIDERT